MTKLYRRRHESHDTVTTVTLCATHSTTGTGYVQYTGTQWYTGTAVLYHCAGTGTLVQQYCTTVLALVQYCGTVWYCTVP